jgi:hypothetical protein
MKVLALVLSTVFLSSCMHLGMMGTHGGGRSGEHQTAQETRLEKEVVRDDINATAVFPPLALGKETLIELRLSSLQGSQPVSNAAVSFHATYVHQAGGSGEHDAHMMHSKKDSLHARPKTDRAISFDQEVRESSQRGLYSIAFTPSQSGEHRLMFHVTAIGDEKVEPELIIEATRNVASPQLSHGGMMHGIDSTSEYLIIGGALMGAMMIVMWVTRGSIF